jgi:peptidyl-prolyl cis-trans isomerase D
MAKSTEDTPKKKSKGASMVVWALMAMLVLGLGGFGVTNFGAGNAAIGSVGDRDIEMNDYARSLQQEINALTAQIGTPITMQQALSLGIDRQVRQQLINTAALDNEAARIGVSAGGERVAREITSISSFAGASGSFDPESYRFALQRSNLTVAAYEQRLREDMARALLQGAVASGFVAPNQITDTLYTFISERRSFNELRLSETDLAALPGDPTEEDLKAHYEANIAEFTKPEARRITYAALLPESIADQIDVDEASLRRVYDERKAEFQQPERRLVERLVYLDDASAEAAKAKLEAGSSFEGLVAERGLELIDIDMGDMAQEDLGAAGDALFALTEPGVVGPFASNLGPALFRMNGILAAQNTSFEDARADLSVEFAADAARRAIDDLIEDLDDRLAGGATLEDLAAETEMSLAVIDLADDTNEGIAAYPAFRTAATAVTDGDFPEIVQLEDGGVFALRLDEIVPPTPIPLEKTRDAVEESWRATALANALSERAIAIKSQIEAGASLGAFGIVSVVPSIARTSTLDGRPADIARQIFTMQEGQARVIEAAGYVAVVVLDAVTPGDKTSDDAAALKAAISVQAEQGLGQDAFLLFTNALTSSAGISIDDAAIAAVHTQFQ